MNKQENSKSADSLAQKKNIVLRKIPQATPMSKSTLLDPGGHFGKNTYFFSAVCGKILFKGHIFGK